MKNAPGYHKDLAFIHDRGYSSFSLNAAAQIVELGCGSGQLAQVFLSKGFSVTGIDFSSEMVARARRNAPQGRFSVGSIWGCRIPQAGAVLSVGEVLNYQFDGKVSLPRLRRLFTTVYNSLLPSGVFVFDILCTRQTGKVIHSRNFHESDGWLVAVEKSDSSASLTRRIITFVKHKTGYRKSVEVHNVRKYNLHEVVSLMRDAGFHVSIRSGYAGAPLGSFHKVILGQKPSEQTIHEVSNRAGRHTNQLTWKGIA